MKIKQLKLSRLSERELKEKEMNAILGGNSCSCSCYWEGRGGSSINDNNMANYKLDTSSIHGCNQFTYSDEMGANYWPEALHA